MGALFSATVFGQQAAQTFTLDGRLFSDTNATTALVESGIQIKVQVLDQNQTCILYEESQTVDTSGSNGYFTLQIGSPTGAAKRGASDSGNSMAKVYSNTQIGVAGRLVSNNNVCTYNPVNGDQRYLRVVVSPPVGAQQVLTPNMEIDSVPMAMVAERAENLQGLTPNQLLKVNTTAPASLSQANLENIFSTTNYPRLTTLLSVPPANYLQTGTNGSVEVPNVSGAPGAGLTAGQFWYDTGSNQLKYYNGTGVQTLGTAGSGITALTVTNNLTAGGVAGGTLNASGTIDLNTTGIAAGTYTKLTVDTFGRATAGTQITGSDITSGTIGGSTAVNTTGTIQTSTDITSARFFLFDHSGVGPGFIGMKAPTAVTTNYTMTFPGTAGASGQVLTTDGTGVLTWTTPSITSGMAVTAPIVNTGTASAPNIGITKSDATHDGYLAQADWTAFNNKMSTSLADGKILVGNGSGVATAVGVTGDVTMLDTGATTVGKIQGTAVSATAPTAAGQVLLYNGTTQYAPGYIGVTDIRSVQPGNAQFFPTTCAASDTLTYSAVTDKMSCTPIAITDSSVTFGSKAANTFLAAPNGAAGAPTFRTIVAADLPANAYDTTYFKNGGNSFGGTATLGTADNNKLVVNTNGTAAMTIDTAQKVGIGVAVPSATLNLKAGVAAVGGAPLKLTAGANLTAPEAGAIEFDGTSLFYTDSTNTRRTLGVAGAGISALTGDVTASGAGSVPATVAKVNGVAYGTSPATNTVPVVTGGNTVTYTTVPNAALTNSSITLGTTNVALGATATSLAALNSVGVGTNATTTGTVTFANGGAGGAAVTVQNNSATTGYNFNLPSAAGSAGQVLTSGGGAAAPMTWTTLPTALTTNLNSGQIFVGSAGNVTTAVTAAGDATISNTGATTVAKVNGVAYGTSPATGTMPVITGANTATYSATPTLGENAMTTGKLALANGAPSGAATTIQPNSGTTAAWTMTLPSSGGTSGYFLQTDGSGNTTWAPPTGSGTVNSGTQNQLAWYSATGAAVGGLTNQASSVLLTNGSSVPAWSAISNDNFTQYALLAGRAGGQTVNGGTAANDNITIDSTSNGTKGFVLLAPTGGSVGIGVASPTRKLDVSGPIHIAPAALPGTPAAGELAFDSGASNALKFYDGSAWQTVGTGTGNGDFLKNGTIAMTGALQMGTQNITGVGTNITATGALTVGSTGANSLTLTSANTTGTAVNITATGAGGGVTIAPNATGNFVAGGGSTSGTITVGNASTGASTFGNTGAASVTTLQGGSGASGQTIVTSAGTGASAVAINATGANGGITLTPNGTGVVTTATPVKITPTALPGTPAAGMLAFDSGASNALKFYDGSAWQTVGTGTGNGDFLKNGSIAMTGALQMGTQNITGVGTNITATGALTVGSTGANSLTLTSANTTASAVNITATGAAGGVTITPNATGNFVAGGGSTSGTITVGNASTGASTFGNTGAASVTTVQGGSGASGQTIVTSAGTGASAVAINATGVNGGISLTPNGTGVVTTATPIKITPTALPGTPAAGMLAFDSGASNALKFYNGTAWQTVGTGTGSGDFMKNGSVAMTGAFDGGAQNLTNIGATITGASAITLAASGSNKSVTLAPTGTGSALLGSKVGLGTTTVSHALEVSSNSGIYFPAHWDPKLRIPRGQVVAAASIVSPKY